MTKTKSNNPAEDIKQDALKNIQAVFQGATETTLEPETKPKMKNPFPTYQNEEELAPGQYVVKLTEIDTKDGQSQTDGEPYTMLIYKFKEAKTGKVTRKWVSASIGKKSKNFAFLQMLAPTGGIPSDVLRDREKAWEWVQSLVGNKYRINVGIEDGKDKPTVISAMYESSKTEELAKDELAF